MSQAIGNRDVLSTRLAGFAAVLSDLDGCLISGETVLGAVPELFGRFGDVLWIVSNNSTDTAISLSALLADMGLTIAQGRFFLVGEQVLRRIAREQPGARIALYAAAPLQDLARELGQTADRKHPEVTVLARNSGFAFRDRRELTSHQHRSLLIWVTNGDASHPGPARVAAPGQSVRSSTQPGLSRRPPARPHAAGQGVAGTFHRRNRPWGAAAPNRSVPNQHMTPAPPDAAPGRAVSQRMETQT